MKRIEFLIGATLFCFFFYSLIEISFSITGNLESSPTFIIPFRIGEVEVFFGLMGSGLSAVFFPLWNVGEYLGTMNMKKVFDYKLRYKIDYLLILLGYIGLLSWLRVHEMFGLFWWYGTLCIFLSISNIIRLAKPKYGSIF